MIERSSSADLSGRTAFQGEIMENCYKCPSCGGELNPDGNGFYVCAACGRAFRRTDSGENGGSAAVRRTESTENAVSGNAEGAVPAVDVVCDAGPGEYDDAGFQNEKHTKIVCFLYVIREVSCRINVQCGLLSCQIR